MHGILKEMSFNNWDWMKLPRIAPWIVISGFMVAAIMLVALSRSVLNGGTWDGDQEFEVAYRALLKGPGKPPVLAYWISGTGGENEKILRLLKAVYHPRNHYLIHLDAGSMASERMKLARAIQSDKTLNSFGNVDVMGKTYAVDRTGPSLVAATLHGAAVLLKVNADWDWFITLSSSDYPIVTQDDLLHVFTSLPRSLNFIDHTSDLGWKEFERFGKVVVDPSLHMATNTQFFYASETRKTPDAFKIFTGSPWVTLSRPFVEHCVHSWDNLPRKLLMYFSNVAYTMESYFQTVVCNSPEFRNTTVNNDLRYVIWDDPPKLESVSLNQSHYKGMLKSGAAFARWFVDGDPVLQKIDESILRRPPDGVGHGMWCSGTKNGTQGGLEEDPCSSWGDINVVKPTPLGKKLRRLVKKLVSDERMHANQCKI